MTLVSLESLVKRFGKETAVKDLSFQIKEGSCTALLGPNGAGKTTTLRMLAGLLQPTDGKIRFTGMKDGDNRQYIGYLPQHPVFYNWMNANEFLIYVGQLAHLTKKESQIRADKLLELVGLADAKKRRIGGFSGGMKQRLGIAQAMIHEPMLLMLDEPVSALDPVGRREVIEMMRELKKKTTILFSTHVLHDAEEVCDEIVIMQKGKLALSGSLDELRKRHQHDVIIISADGDITEWAQGLKSIDVITDVRTERTTATITVSRLEAAREGILQDILDKRIPVISFQVGQSSLEDVFMKVVSE
ncbi:ABC transporter ATP-binding protein [Ferdinandcohnia quinoae]|uniref:ABC transporter ATP-binding protein n=1 Tax=Fredinandcohnia quinoae TaxID=2918902 RepID=A0AAW5E8R9_9BACI|nr:ABC transporter ATP-binding protein [Fredinandcohnia sp. SECRCQ15]MCH1625164.1 ABC transporter ATP-binding protein [Fredinandcohnia sp. SECRCQ15]